jgi:hypothetical protein
VGHERAVSVKAMSWVFDHSPYTLGTRLVHLAIADVANEDNDHQVWVAQAKIAAKAKVSVRTVRTALAQMVEDGALEEVSREAGGTTTYRMKFTTPAKSAEGKSTTEDPGRKRPEPRQIADSRLLLTQGTQDPNTTDADPLLGFQQFWDVYPQRNGKRLGRGKVERMWAKLTLDDRRAAWRGARNYAAGLADSGLSAADPERWVRDRRWTDWQTPATPDRPTTGPRRPDPLEGRHAQSLDQLLALGETQKGDR